MSRCIIGRFCKKHGFVHGAEAEELRQRLECEYGHHKGVRVILDEIDARDSLAFLEDTRVHRP